MKSQFNKYGRCLTTREFEIAVSNLLSEHSASWKTPGMPTGKEEQQWIREERELLMDHRLGLDFPRERRDAMHAAWMEVDAQRVSLFFKQLATSLFKNRKPSYDEVTQDNNVLVDFIVKKFGDVLDKEDVTRLLGDESERALPHPYGSNPPKPPKP